MNLFSMLNCRCRLYSPPKTTMMISSSGYCMMIYHHRLQRTMTTRPQSHPLSAKRPSSKSVGAPGEYLRNPVERLPFEPCTTYTATASEFPKFFAYIQSVVPLMIFPLVQCCVSPVFMFTSSSYSVSKIPCGNRRKNEKIFG